MTTVDRGDLTVTAALSRAQSALANAGASTATLAQTVLDAHKVAERREREADRKVADAEARIVAAEARVAEFEARENPSAAELQKVYRRGYETGYRRAKTGRSADVERALSDPRNTLRAVS